MKSTIKKAVSVNSVGRFFKALQLVFAKTPSPTLPRWERELNCLPQIRRDEFAPSPTGGGLGRGLAVERYDKSCLYKFTDIANKI